MAQVNLTIDMIMNKAVMVLENQLVYTRNVNRQYDSSFSQKGAKIGDSVRIRLPDRVKSVEGPNLQPEQRNEQENTLTLTKQRHVDVQFTTAEMALDIDDFTDRILMPRMSQLAADVDYDVASNTYKSFYHSVGTPGTTPGTTRVLTQAQTKLDNAATPRDGQRFLNVNPDANGELVEGFKGLFHNGSDISSQFKSGLMSNNVLGYKEISMSQSVPTHTTGSRNTAGTVATTVTTEGATSVALSGLGSSATVKAGDVFTIAGVFAVNPQTRASTGALQQFTVTADATADGSGNATVSVSPAIYTATQSLATVDSFPQSSAVTTFLGAASTQYAQNLAYHKDSIIFATADLVVPQKVEMSKRVAYKGLSLRFVQDYSISTDVLAGRIDILYGWLVNRPETGVRMWG